MTIFNFPLNVHVHQLIQTTYILILPIQSVTASSQVYTLTTRIPLITSFIAFTRSSMNWEALRLVKKIDINTVYANNQNKLYYGIHLQY